MHIRPICLIQVERTGRDQRLPGVVHAEDAREYLMERPAVPHPLARSAARRQTSLGPSYRGPLRAKATVCRLRD